MLSSDLHWHNRPIMPIHTCRQNTHIHKNKYKYIFKRHTLLLLRKTHSNPYLIYADSKPLPLSFRAGPSGTGVSISLGIWKCLRMALSQLTTSSTSVSLLIAIPHLGSKMAYPGYSPNLRAQTCPKIPFTCFRTGTSLSRNTSPGTVQKLKSYHKELSRG